MPERVRLELPGSTTGSAPAPASPALTDFVIGLTIGLCVGVDAAAWSTVRLVAHMMENAHAHTPILDLAAWAWLTYGVLPSLGLGLVLVAALRWPRDIALALAAVIGASVLLWGLYGLYMCNALFWGFMWELA